jgi:hypothetical protein
MTTPDTPLTSLLLGVVGAGLLGVALLSADEMQAIAVSLGVLALYMGLMTE